MKTLIIYATKYGCTQKAANILKSNLNEDTILVNILKEKVPPLSGFDTVILGGSIYVGRIQKKLTDYILRELPQLLTKKVGLFICAGQKEEIRRKELETSFPKELFEHSVAKEVFGYEFDFEKLSFFHKFVVRKVSGISTSKFKLSSEIIKDFANTLTKND